jgi:hypothetical protein
MIEVQQQNYSNKSFKKAYSKVTTAISSNKHSVLKNEQKGIAKSKTFETLFPTEPKQYIKAMRKNIFIFPEKSASSIKSLNLK